MEWKIKPLLFVIAIVLIIIALIVLIKMNVSTNIGENEFIGKWNETDFIGKWKIFEKIHIYKGDIDEFAKFNYTLRFFGNGTYKKLTLGNNNSWEWDNWTLRDDYLIFGEPSLDPDVELFQRTYYEFSEDATKLTLRYAHINNIEKYYKVQ